MNELPILDPKQLDMLRELDPEGAPELIRELVGIFEEDAPQRIAELKAALAAGAAPDASAAAHALKGGVANLGLVRLAELARRAELAAREGNLGPVADLIGPLEAALAEALAALKEGV